MTCELVKWKGLELSLLQDLELMYRKRPQNNMRLSVGQIFECILTHCGRVTQICVFNTVKLGTSASSS
jgi:hypothetical protein